MAEGGETRLSRRRLLQAGALAAAAGWAPAFRVPASAQSRCTAPPGFPAGIDLYRQAFENWSRGTVIDDLWTCAPRTAADVVRLANWARKVGWRLRPRGAMHGWSPICVTADTSCDDRVVLVDTTAHLTAIEILPGRRPAVRAGAGATMDAVSEAAGIRGYGFLALPATGGMTVAGGLAVGMHGASLPGRGERRGFGRAYGSLSNLITSFTAVVWSRRRGRYVLQRFDRADPDAKAFLVHLGRAFITEVTLRLAPDQNVRCVSHIDIPASELFAPPGSPGRTFQSFVDEAGRVESIWFPFTESPWLKVWSVEPEKPPTSRRVSAPYNYPFSDNAPLEVAELAAAIINGNTALTPLFGQAEHGVVRAGLPATGSADIWGPSRTTLYYIRASTLRVDEHGYAVLTKRRNIQRVLHAFTSFHERRLNELRAQGRFPINGPLELRSCGIDHPRYVGVRGAEAPSLAPTVPRRDRRRWDTAIWINVLTFAGTPGQDAYYREIEEWMRANFRDYAMLRAEWSKGWACTDEAQWDDPVAIKRLIPHSLQVGRREDEDWNWAVRTLDRHDPHRVFSNAFLDRLLRVR